MSDQPLDIVERLRISDYMLIEAADEIESLRTSLGQTTATLDALIERHTATDDYETRLCAEIDALLALLREARAHLVHWAIEPRRREFVARIDAALGGGEEA